ncbi:collagen-like protein [Nostoc sp. DedQUE09]|uniref:collagen-like protein n=1 Tax=Nostoc sp. DedQUE09 TaxID=3075394 RepID=UPI002AD39046|nr:collagen-like protein [Nostoc sp. DedQUE09]MDZ7950075.1 collagen-like protein [Nostoc sp. DedQUE09]
MGTTTLTKAVLMIIRVIWFRANRVDTKAHDRGVWSGEAGEQGSRGAGERGSRGAGEQGSRGEIAVSFPLCTSASYAQYFSTRGCANGFSTRRCSRSRQLSAVETQYKCPIPNAQFP